MEAGVASRGKVLSFDPIRGYGFIAPEGGGEDVFLHVNDLLDEKNRLRTGVLVQFRVENGERGLKASSVKIVETAEVEMVTAGEDGEDDADGFCDVLDLVDFRGTLTEVLLNADPGLTAGQILKVRRGLEVLALKYGWVEAT